jgi:hypothetical protein
VHVVTVLVGRRASGVSSRPSNPSPVERA